MDSKYIFADILFGLGLILIIFGLMLTFRPSFAAERTEYGDTNRELTVSSSDYTLDYEGLYEGETVVIEIKGGMNTLDVAEVLSENNIVDIRSFLQLISYFDLEKNIRAGRYVFEEDDDLSDVLQKITIRR